MRIVCVVKFVPDVDKLNYDFDKNILIRDQARLTLNPDDASGTAVALRLKKEHPGTSLEVITMAPISVLPNLEDLLRMGFDKGTLLSDREFAGSDTYATSRILARYLSSCSFDYIITGTHAVDGDTSHVPAQLGEWLGISQISGVSRLDFEHFNEGCARVSVEQERSMETYEVDSPAILSLSRESGYKLPYLRKADMDRYVKDHIQVVDRQALGLPKEETGLSGSRTKVLGTCTKQFEKRNRVLVKADEAGVETVFSYLVDKGIL